MNHVSCALRGAVAAVLMLAVGAHEAAAQMRARVEAKSGGGYTPPVGAAAAGGGIVRIRDLTGVGPRGLVRSPEFTVSVSRGRVPAREWAELQLTFDSEPEWIDELSVQYYALLYSRMTKEYTLLKGSVSHVDVAKGRGHLSAGYIRPSTLQRYGEVVAVAVEVLSKGEVVATSSEGKLPDRQALPTDWWKNAKLVPRDGYILSRTLTPFASINYDDYEVTK